MDRQARAERAESDQRARELRREMSMTERRVWSRLRRRQLSGFKFRRQVPIGPYFADFACLKAGLVVEVDGDHHGEQAAYDARRDRYFAGMDFEVLRFWLSEIDENLDGVVETIGTALTPHLPPCGGR